MKSMIIANVWMFSCLALTAAAEEQKAEEKPYDLVLVEHRVTFPNGDELMNRDVDLLVRDLGIKDLLCFEFTTGLSLVWDGKAYDFKMRGGMGGSGPMRIKPKSTWGTSVRLRRYDIPPSALTKGKHTIAVRDGFAESNTITVFIENNTR